MRIEGVGQLLRIFVGESDRWEGRPLYEAIVRAAREQGLAGATALRGIEGFGANSRIHTVKVLRLSEDLPIVVEIVDQPERIAKFLPMIDRMVTEGLVTLESVSVRIYRHADRAGSSPDEQNELQLESADFAPPTAAPSGLLHTSAQARQVIEAAKTSAAGSRRVFADSVDVLLALLSEQDGHACSVLAELNVDAESLERTLREVVDREEPSDDFLILLETKSLGAAKWLGHDYVASEHLLLALCQIRPSAATDVLMRLGAPPRDICQQVLQRLGHQHDWQRWLADHPDL